MKNFEMVNTRTSFSWILLAKVLFCLAIEKVSITPDRELYVVKNPTTHELTCISEDDDAALVWNYDLNTSEPFDHSNDFKPVKPKERSSLDSECAVWRLNQCLIKWGDSKNLETVSTLPNHMAPVVDYRWEGFKEYVAKNNPPVKVLLFENIDGTVVFSIRGTQNVEIYLCQHGEFRTSLCYLIKLAVNGKYSVIKNCQPTESQCREGACSATHESAILDAHEWRAFRLQLIRSERKIKVFRDMDENAFLECNLPKLRLMNSIWIRSGPVARIRFHTYNYVLFTDVTVPSTTSEFNWPNNHFCINMLVSICPSCQLTVKLTGDDTDNSKLVTGDEQFYQSGLRTWRTIKLNFSSSSSSAAHSQLTFIPGLNHSNPEVGWWAIDDLRLCEPNDGVRWSTITLPLSDSTRTGVNIRCQKLLRNETVVADSYNGLSLQNTSRLGEYIQRLIKPLPPNNTTEYNGTSGKYFQEKTANRDTRGARCLDVIPRNTSLELQKTSDFSVCQDDKGSYSFDVRDVSQFQLLGHQTCFIFPCTFTIVQLKPFTEYKVIVKSSSGTIILNETAKTLESAPGEIRDLSSESISATSVTGKWNLPDRVDGVIRSYTVLLKRVELLGCTDHRKPSPEEPEIMKNVTNTTASFSDLHPYARYRFRVIANTIEPGPPATKMFETAQLNIPTSNVSNLRLINESCLAWDPPTDCTTVTGPAKVTKLEFWSISEWAKNWSFNDSTALRTYFIKFELLPYTEYRVCAYVIRGYHLRENSSNCQPLSWTTKPVASRAVKNIQIYEADALRRTISVEWEPSYPPTGKIEFYQMSISNGDKMIGSWSPKVSELKKCNQSSVCVESLSLPSNVTINDTLTIFARNANVTKDGAVIPKWFSLDNLYNKAPGQPEQLEVTPREYGTVTLKWSQPSLTPTQIVRFKIQADCLHTNLTTHPCKDILPIYYNITNPHEKSHSTELYLLSSTEYRLQVMALNYRYKISTPITKNVLTPGSVSFASKDKLRVINEIDVVEFEVPAVLNATMYTTIVIQVEGLLSCASNPSRNESSSKNKTNITRDFDAVKYSVTSSQPVNFSFKLNKYYGVEKICSFQHQETYIFKAILEDPGLGRPLILRTPPVIFTNQKPSAEQSQTWLVIISILVICLLLFILFILYWKRKRARIQSGSSCNLPLVRTMNTSNTSPCISKRLSVPHDTTEYQITIEKNDPDVVPYNPHSYPVKVEEFEEYAKEALTHGVLDSQYETFSTCPLKSCEIGRLPENMAKNRFKDIIPYDDNRVVLRSTDEDSTSDYINASYVQGYRKVKAYIATQGPIRNQKTKVDTVPDFWRMVWQENVRIICMLANVKENNKKKCEKYWPEVGESVTYNDIEISNIQHEVFADYTIRTFDVRCQSTKRKIMHFHYTGWPDHGVPTYTQSLVAYLKKLLATPAGKGPIVVHCSAGVGRTGTIILCDICLRQAVKERVIDVLATTLKMRQDRICMVQNSQQYLLAHLVILESMTPAQTLIHCNSQLNEKIAELRKQLPVDVKRLGEIVWQDRVLHKLAERPDSEDVMQNRTSHFDTDRPDLTQDGPSSTPVDEKSPIDVVTVDGYKGKEQYLATQLPTPSTLAEFWRLIAEKRIELIVVLQRPRPKKSVHCDIKPDEPSFAPLPHLHVEAKSTPEDMGHFTIEKVSVTDTSEEGRRRIEFEAEPDEEGVQPVTIITCTGWERKVKGTPPPATGLVSLWIASEKIRRKETPTLVMCHDGVTGCGLYLALSFLLEWMAVERECDVISAVRAIRRFRPEFVQSLQQFEYLYDAAIDYNRHFETYANFS